LLRPIASYSLTKFLLVTAIGHLKRSCLLSAFIVGNKFLPSDLDRKQIPLCVVAKAGFQFHNQKMMIHIAEANRALQVHRWIKCSSFVLQSVLADTLNPRNPSASFLEDYYGATT